MAEPNPICPFCEHQFDRRTGLRDHLDRINKCYEDTPENLKTLKATVNKYKITLNGHPSCLYCHKEFATKGSLDRHLKAICPKDPDLANKLKSRMNTCQSPTENNDQEDRKIQFPILSKAPKRDPVIDGMIKEIEDLKRIVNEVLQKDKSSHNLFQTHNNNNNQSFQVMAIDGDLLALLSDRLDNLDKARLRIANCAMGTIESDCRLIEDIYNLNETGDPLSGGPALRYIDSKRTKVECFDKSGQRIVKTKAQLGDSLAVQIIDAYSITLEYCDNYHNKHKRYPIKNMDSSQVQDWNEHMGRLSDLKYRKGLVNRLKIPDKDRSKPMG